MFCSKSRNTVPGFLGAEIVQLRSLSQLKWNIFYEVACIPILDLVKYIGWSGVLFPFLALVFPSFLPRNASSRLVQQIVETLKKDAKYFIHGLEDDKLYSSIQPFQVHILSIEAIVTVVLWGYKLPWIIHIEKRYFFCCMTGCKQALLLSKM